ncbi:MAG: hypothetical protein AAF478_14460 [Pseudomonadota bacterium]
MNHQTSNNSQGNIAVGNLHGNQGVAIGRTIHQANNFYQGVPPSDTKPNELADSLALLGQLPLDETPAVQPLPAGSRLDHRPNPHFVGREAELRTLAARFKAMIAGHQLLNFQQLRNFFRRGKLPF